MDVAGLCIASLSVLRAPLVRYQTSERYMETLTHSLSIDDSLVFRTIRASSADNDWVFCGRADRFSRLRRHWLTLSAGSCMFYTLLSIVRRSIYTRCDDRRSAAQTFTLHCRKARYILLRTARKVCTPKVEEGPLCTSFPSSLLQTKCDSS
jgi:hypothetical protein